MSELNNPDMQLAAGDVAAALAALRNQIAVIITDEQVKRTLEFKRIEDVIVHQGDIRRAQIHDLTRELHARHDALTHELDQVLALLREDSARMGKLEEVQAATLSRIDMLEEQWSEIRQDSAQLHQDLSQSRHDQTRLRGQLDELITSFSHIAQQLDWVQDWIGAHPSLESTGNQTAWLNNLINLTDDAMIVINEARKIVWINAEVEAMFGYWRNDLIGQEIETLIPERYRDVHVDHVAAFAHSDVQHCRMTDRPEVMARHKDGSEFPVRVSISKHPDGFAALVRASWVTR